MNHSNSRQRIEPNDIKCRIQATLEPKPTTVTSHAEDAAMRSSGTHNRNLSFMVGSGSG